MTTESVAQRGIPSLPREITPKEQDALTLAAVGLGNHNIAALLAISKGTVANLLHTASGKLNASGRTRAVAQALQLGVLFLGEGTALLQDTTQARIFSSEESKYLNRLPTAKPLTERELRVLALLAGGATTETILNQLQVKKAALEAIMESIMTKTYALDRTHAMVIALRFDWLTIEAETA